MSFDIRVYQPDDNGLTVVRADLADSVLCSRVRIGNRNIEIQIRKPDDFVVQLRLSLMRTFWELKGYLDLPYIDSIIRQVIQNFKNKHHREIEQKYWAILTDMCKQEIDHAARIEPEEETDPVDIDVDDDDIDAWINSEL